MSTNDTTISRRNAIRGALVATFTPGELWSVTAADVEELVDELDECEACTANLDGYHFNLERFQRAVDDMLGGTALNKRAGREDRLRALGFDDPTNEERRERLALNAALKDWPKR